MMVPKNVKIMALKFLSNFGRTLEMPLINCEINLILTWSANCVISNAAVNQATTFAITYTKLYVPVVTLSTQDNAKLLKQLKSGFKRTVKPMNVLNPHSDFLINPSFQGVNRLFVLSFNVLDNKNRHSRFYFPTAQVEDCNVIIDGKNVFDQPIKNNIKTCTARKVSKYGVFSGPHFSVFGLNTDIYSVNLHTQSKYGKIRTRKNSVFGHFSRSDMKTLQLVREMITQVVVCCAIIILRTLQYDSNRFKQTTST